MVAFLLWLIPVILIGLIIIIFIYYYNKFVILDNRIENSLSQIDVQLRKRADLVPNLISTVKGYAKHEEKIMASVTKARQALVNAGNIQSKIKAGDQLQNALRSVFAIAENYPNLKANENFLHLQQELSAIEDKIAYARQFYNDSVLSLQNASRSFPGVFFFKMFGRKEKEYLKIPEASRAVPKVEF